MLEIWESPQPKQCTFIKLSHIGLFHCGPKILLSQALLLDPVGWVKGDL